MTKINLREYHDEIENMINKGRNDEAVAHCRNILSAYPKSIDTYRLLGKAFLEAKRYTDAIDIFNRVLSTVPDDFVSHLGLSIIREDEGDLDTAIWHMERAFENQPYNSAIQEELRRLFERRDGSAPPRMRLTRVALARMYVKGNLYQQASAEIRSILNKEPQRIDLQNLLAKMYLKSGKKVEAAEVSSKILHRLPYCLDANMVLANVLTESDRKEEASVYRQRLAALNPYTEYTNQEQPIVDLVVDSAVMLDLLDYQSSDLVPTEEQADWMTTLGLTATELESDLDEDLPDWLIAASAQIQTEESTSDLINELPGDLDESLAAELLISESSEDIDMIEWLGSTDQNTRYAETVPGLDDETTSKDDTSQDLLGLVDVETQTPADEEELESAEIPDWLKSLAPESIADETLDTDEKIAGIPSQTEADWDVPDADESDNNNFYTAGAAAGVAAAADFLFNQEDEIPDDDEKSSEIEQAAVEADFSQTDQSGVFLTGAVISEPVKSDMDEFADWLNEFQEESEGEIDASGKGAIAESTMGEGSTDLPDWLKEIDEPEFTLEERQPALPEEQITNGEVPTRLSEISEDTEAISREESDQVDELPVWLQELEEESAVRDFPINDNQLEQLTEETRSTKEEPPDWLESFAETEPGPTEEYKPLIADQFESSIRTTTPENEDIQNQIELEEPPDFADADEAMAWLASLAGQAPAEIEKELDIENQPGIPDSTFQTETTNSYLGETKQPEEIELEPPPDFENADDAMAWLEDLAAKSPIQDSTPGSDISSSDEIQIDEEEVPEIEIKPGEIEPIPTAAIIKLDINRAALVDIERIPGIGYPIAQAIVAYRETHGLFSDIDELANVPGLNPDDIFTLQEYFFAEATPAKPASPVHLENKLLLNQARQLISQGEITEALMIYTELIKAKTSLDDVIFDLNKSLQIQAENYELWQTLGDAYMRNDQMIEAMQAYNKAEELLG